MTRSTSKGSDSSDNYSQGEVLAIAFSGIGFLFGVTQGKETLANWTLWNTPQSLVGMAFWGFVVAISAVSFQAGLRKRDTVSDIKEMLKLFYQTMLAIVRGFRKLRNTRD